MFHDIVGAVFEYVAVFFFVYIQANPKEFAGADTLDQVFGLNQAAPGSVDQYDALLHFLNRIPVDQMVSSVSKRTM